MTRIVCHFSCGAASAVAAKLALADFGHDRVVIYNAFVAEEDADNRRFLADCERWFDHQVIVLRDDHYGASAREVWRRKRYIANHFGAPCSGLLKREVMEPHFRADDEHVYGYTAEESTRAERFAGMGWHFPLIERSLTKSDCLAMVERAGIQLPRMYGLGFNNANCVGCCKGGEGYWNLVRITFPEVFEETAKIQEDIGPGSYFFRNRKSGERFSLRDLDPTAGRHDEPLPSCSFFCAMAEEEIA